MRGETSYSRGKEPVILAPGEAIRFRDELQLGEMLTSPGVYDFAVRYYPPDTERHQEYESEHVVWSVDGYGPLTASAVIVVSE